MDRQTQPKSCVHLCTLCNGGNIPSNSFTSKELQTVFYSPNFLR